MVFSRRLLPLFSRARLGGLALSCSLVAGLFAGMVAPAVSPESAGAVCDPVVLIPAAVVPGSNASSAHMAAQWLRLQQLPNGSFEMADFPGFETPDAILALAEDAQTASTWSTAEARAGVESAVQACGITALDWIDNFAEEGLEAGDAARMVIFVAKPLGLSTTQFDPGNDGNAINLEAIIAGGKVGGSYGTFGGTLWVATALRLLGRPVPPETVTFIRGGQHADGSWDYTGDLTTDTASDFNSTAMAMIALVAAGAERGDTNLVRALAYVASQQQADGGFREAFDEATNPNATGLGILAIRAAGFNSDNGVWRGIPQPSGASALSVAYISPRDALRATQTVDGNYASPYDIYGLNTFATTGGIHAMLANWIVNAFAIPLQTPPTTTTTTTTAPSTTTLVVAGGALANTGASQTTPFFLLGVLSLLAGLSLLNLRRRRIDA